MVDKGQKPSGWIGRRMEDLERESKDWPIWKQEDLRERLERDGVQCVEPSDQPRGKS